MKQRTCLVIILAAGQGTRMKSALPKVLHEIGGLSMIGHVTRRMKSIPGADLALVIGPDQQAVADAVCDIEPGVTIHVQGEPLGTAHAALAARDAIQKGYDDVLIAFGDTPFVTGDSVERLRAPISGGAAVVVAGMTPDDAAAYGRLITRGDDLLAIREYRDASPDEREIGLCNGGLMVLDGSLALDLLTRIGNDNAQQEYYLPAAVEIAVGDGRRAAWVPVDEAEMLGVNSAGDLAAAERRFQEARRQQALADGAILVAPETVFFAHDTHIEAGVTIEPNVVFAQGVRIESGATVRAFSHLEGATVGAGATVGPFVRLRPGAAIGANAKVGNFCEVKNAEIGSGAKASHLTYIGDATIGENANIGAGTIVCNYDGSAKHRTVIGESAFVGSNSALVAPVTIGTGAYVASGSVITEDVSDDALAFGRARQVEKLGRARVMRNRKDRD